MATLFWATLCIVKHFRDSRGAATANRGFSSSFMIFIIFSDYVKRSHNLKSVVYPPPGVEEDTNVLICWSVSSRLVEWVLDLEFFRFLLAVSPGIPLY